MKKLGLILFVVFFCAACKKNALGNDCIIEGTVVHHNKTITNASVFIKFNATDLPSEDTTKYDAKVRVDKDGHFKFSTLKGHYFLYASGIDPGIAPPYVVVGGLAVKLRKKESVNVTLYVTEGD